MRSSLTALTDRGQVAKAVEYARRIGAPTFEERVTLCELEVLSGNRDVAAKMVAALVGSAAPPEVLLRALLVAGRLSFYYGDPAEGKAKFVQADELAAKLPDPTFAALSLSCHIEALLRYDGFESALSRLNEYRRAALRTGTAQGLFTLHRILAEAELKSGRSFRALRELELARTHIEAIDNICSEALLELTHSATYGLLGDPATAQRHAERAELLALHSGAHALVHNALTNASHFQVLLGRLGEAEATIASIRSQARGPDASLNIRATELMLATATRDVITANSIDAACAPIVHNRNSVSARWYRLAQVSHFIATRRDHEAASLAHDCLTQSGETHDLTYVDRVRLVLAEALALNSLGRDAVGAVTPVALGPQARLPEFIASTQRVSGRIASDSPTAAQDHFARAARIYGHIGHIVGRGESLHNAASLRASQGPAGSAEPVPHITTFYTEPPATFGRVDGGTEDDAASDAIAQSLRAAAALVDLASRPALAGYELLSLVAGSGAAAAAVLVAVKGQAREILGWVGTEQAERSLLRAGDDTVTLSLGLEGGREVSVVVRPRNQGAARTTLLALQRLTVNGLTLHRADVAESERSALWPDPLPEQQLGLIAASESMLSLLSAARRVAASHFAVLITGETGTGKELLARAIHKSSPRREQRFQPFNCTAVARDMLDSQLFGYKRGSFTGAIESFPGVLRNAAGGTLLLDEIGEIGMEVQPKLLRFLESSEVHPLGEPAPLTVDVRVVAATNANLEKLVEQGRFREDLYYRLNVVHLPIPPLRERREEIPLLIEHFLERSRRECGKSGVRIGEAATEYLLLYNWPGNVRELANEIRRAVALAEPNAVLMPEHLSPRLGATRRTVPAAERPADVSELVVRRDQPLAAAVEHVERAFIQDALRRHTNVEDAARSLGLSRKGLYLKRQRLKLDE